MEEKVIFDNKRVKITSDKVHFEGRIIYLRNIVGVELTYYGFETLFLRAFLSILLLLGCIVFFMISTVEFFNIISLFFAFIGGFMIFSMLA